MDGDDGTVKQRAFKQKNCMTVTLQLVVHLVLLMGGEGVSSAADRPPINTANEQSSHCIVTTQQHTVSASHCTPNLSCNVQPPARDELAVMQPP
jgi:hypothetical protein